MIVEMPRPAGQSANQHVDQAPRLAAPAPREILLELAGSSEPAIARLKHFADLVEDQLHDAGASEPEDLAAAVDRTFALMHALRAEIVLLESVNAKAYAAGFALPEAQS